MTAPYPEAVAPPVTGEQRAPFEREERYIVIKRKHLSAHREARLKNEMRNMGIRTVECVVVESDWPEYETVWSMIEARCTDKPLAFAREQTEEVEVLREALERIAAGRPDAINQARAALSAAEGARAHAKEQAGVEWRCFHCGDVFADRTCAEKHFGRDEGRTPACLIKGADGGLLKALRDAEDQADDAIQAMHDESTDAAKAYHRQRTRHTQALIAAEESGYEKGLADGRALAAPASSVPDRAQLVEALADGLRGMLRLSRMGFEASMREPEENGNYVAFIKAEQALAAYDAALSAASGEGER